MPSFNAFHFITDQSDKTKVAPPSPSVNKSCSSSEASAKYAQSGQTKIQRMLSVENDKDLDEKHILKGLIESALGYLQRSLVIMIKFVMSRLFGTKEVLQELHEINSRLKNLPDNSAEKSGLKANLSKRVNSSCRFWQSDCVETGGLGPEEWVWHDWVWHSRQRLPRKKDPQEEWKDLSEDLKSWKLDICLKLIKHATYNKEDLFTSKYMRFKNTKEEYNAKALTDNTTEVRNIYAHPPPYNILKRRYAQDFLVVEEFATELLRWCKNENGNSEDISKCLENLQLIQKKRKEYLNRHTVDWEKISDGLKNLNFNDFGYILVSTPCNSKIGAAVSKEDLGQLSNIPWDTIVDFDAISREDGLWNSLCEQKGGQYRLKASSQLLAKNIVVPFSYVDIDGAERGELCRDGRIPWIFPHGEVHNKTNEACHFENYDRYYTQIQKPLVTAMRKITTHIVQNKYQGAVSVVFCYGHYAYESQKLPYKNYFSDLKYLCGELKLSGSHVIVLSDNLHLEDILKPFPVFIFPLDSFCKMIQDKLHMEQGNSLAVKMPSLIGEKRILRSITFDEEDFELIHEYIAEGEMLKLLAQEKIHFRQKNEVVSDNIIKSDIKYKLRENLYKGGQVTWISLNADHTITRREEDKIIINIREKLQDHVHRKLETTKYVIYHSKGAGATTLARKILWNLRMEFPCVILKSNYKHSEAKAKCTSQALKMLYDDLQYPILMLVDEEPSFRTIQYLTSCLQELHTPVVFLQVQRVSSAAQQEVRDLKDSFILPCTLHKDDADNLKEKFLIAFGKDKISAGDRRFAQLESSLEIPNEGDQVTDLDLVYSGTITAVTRKQEGAYYLVKVSWHNKKQNNEAETCCIGSFASKSDRKYKPVYLKSAITRKLYETFHFYGIMYLDEDFRESMSDHVQKCLNDMVPDKGMLDNLLKQKILILANLSILFAFKVCESIHVKAFEHLCYAITKSYKPPDKFTIEAFIPDAALEFTITTLKGRFCIIHPIVAEEIIKFYCSISSDTENPSPDFYCDFLNCMLPESEYPNEEALSAVNRLLKYREYIDDDGQGYFTRKPFSELILKLKQNPQHAIKVLECASENCHLQTCHTYGHFARYVSKGSEDFERALDILEQAKTLANKNTERGLLLNIKGDIYRQWLVYYLEKYKTADWEDIKSTAYNLHLHSCQAYQDAHRNNHEDIPLFNELTVRLNLLEAIKKRHEVSKHNQKFLNCVHQLPEPEVAGSVDSCRQLIKDLNEMISEGPSFDRCRDEAHLKSLECRLLDIIGASEKEQKEILCFLMKKPMYVNLVHIRRSYVHLCHPDCCTSPTDLEFCLHLLEENFKLVGHVDRDMKNWLLIIKNIPKVGGNLKEVEEKLLLWKTQGPCITDDKQKIQVKNNPLWVNFYLTICYFIQIIDTNKKSEIPPIVEQFKKVCKEMQEEGKENKSRFQIREWLHHSGTGFGQLRSSQCVLDEMLQLNGSVGIPSWQEARQRRGDKGFPYITWKSICIPFDAKRYSSHQLNQGNDVAFGVGFTFRGPQAVLFIKSDSSRPTSPSKSTSKKEGENSVQTSMSPTLTYSQALSKPPTPEHKPDQQPTPKKKKSRKKKK